MNIYVSNINFLVTNDELRATFEQYGTVESATIVLDKATHRSRGFAFVLMPNNAEAEDAITHLNGFELQKRALSVKEARPQPARV